MTNEFTKTDIPAKIIQGDGEVQIAFDHGIPAERIKKQVGECVAQTCDCCTPEFHQQVQGFEVNESVKGVRVCIRGKISADQVRENMLSCAPRLKNDS